MAAVRADRTPEPVRSFGTFTTDLHRLAAWFAECGVETVAMELTQGLLDSDLRASRRPWLHRRLAECNALHLLDLLAGPGAEQQDLRGRVLSSRTRRTGSRAAVLLRLAAVTVGQTNAALGAFYRRLSARICKAKAVTATARKIAACSKTPCVTEWTMSTRVRPSTTPGTVSGWSKICIGAPRHSALFFSQLSRRRGGAVS